MSSRIKTSVVAGLVAAMMASPALADGFSFGFGYAGRGHHGHGRSWGFSFGYSRPTYVAPMPVAVAPAPVAVAAAPVVAAPVVVTAPARVWVPPVYSTVSERVWVPTTQMYYRDVPVVDAYGRVLACRREPYTVQSGYWTEVTRRVVVREGYWTLAGGPEAGDPGYASPAPQEADGTVDYEYSERAQKSVRATYTTTVE